MAKMVEVVMNGGEESERERQRERKSTVEAPAL